MRGSSESGFAGDADGSCPGDCGSHLGVNSESDLECCPERNPEHGSPCCLVRSSEGNSRRYPPDCLQGSLQGNMARYSVGSSQGGLDGCEVKSGDWDQVTIRVRPRSSVVAHLVILDSELSGCGRTTGGRRIRARTSTSEP